MPDILVGIAAALPAPRRTRSQRSCAARKRDPFRALQDQVLRQSTPGSGFVDLLLMRELTTGERGATDVLSMGILGT